MASDTKDDEVTASGEDHKNGTLTGYDKQDDENETEEEEEASNPHMMSLGDPSANEDTETQLARNNSPAKTGAGSPGLYFWQNIEHISHNSACSARRPPLNPRG